MHGLYSFAVIAEGKEFLLAASSEEEKYKWVEVRIKNTNFSAIVVQDQMCPTTASSSCIYYILHYLLHYKYSFENNDNNNYNSYFIYRHKRDFVQMLVELSFGFINFKLKR